MLRRTKSERKNGEDGVETSVCHMNRTVDHMKVVMSVNAPPFVCDGCFRVVSHPAGSRLMLPSAESQGRRIAPDIDRSGGFQPFDGALSHEFGGSHRLFVRRPGKMRDWNPKSISHLRVERNARFRTWNLMHGSHDLNGSSEGVAHPIFVRLPPTWNPRRATAMPEDDGQLDELVREHSPSDHSRIAMIELRH